MITKPKIYTAEFVEKEVKSLYDILLADESIIYIGELFKSKEYTRERFHEWARDFVDNDEISLTIKRIKEDLESRAVKWAFTWKLNTTMTIFHLKNNYDWKDKTEQDLNHKGDLNFSKIEVEILNGWKV